MAGYDMHRAFRVDLSETVSQSLVVDFLKQQQIIKAAIYHEVAQQTKKPHLQGWIVFSGEAELKAFSNKWTVFKRNYKLDKSKSSVAKFRKGDTAMVYAAKDGQLVWQHGVTDEELKAIAERSYQKGETKKQTFLNAIVQRMKEKKVRSKSAVYYELCEYYYENGKELSPWRLMSQCNTVCRMLWGEKFSRHMAETEVRIEYNAPEEDESPQASDAPEGDSEESASDTEPECSDEHDDVQTVSSSGRAASEQHLAVQPVRFHSGRVAELHRLHGSVHSLQDQRSETAVHASVHGHRRRRRHQ